MEEKAIHIRLDLSPGDPLRGEFIEIKDANGVVSNVEVLRLMIRRCSRKRGKRIYRLKRGKGNVS